MSLAANRRDTRVIRGGVEMLETDAEFAIAIQQAEAGKGDQRVRVHADVYVSDDREFWTFFARVYNGYYRSSLDGGLPRMSDAELVAIAKPSGAKYAELRWGFYPMKVNQAARGRR